MDDKILLAFCGKAGSGKDLCCDIIEAKYRFTKMGFADNLKLIAKEVLGWSGEKDERGRRLLQEFGTACVNYDELFWPKRLENNHAFQKAKRVVISDCRFPHEISWIKEQHGTVVRLVGRGGLPGAAGKHISETALDDYNDFDHIIDNSGSMAALTEQLDLFMQNY